LSSDRAQRGLADILAKLDTIAPYVGERDAAAFAADGKTVDATGRCLQRMTEADIRICGERMRQIAREIPMQAIRGLGNLLRHEYEKIDLGTIFNTVRNDLPILRAACLRALKD